MKFVWVLSGLLVLPGVVVWQLWGAVGMVLLGLMVAASLVAAGANVFDKKRAKAGGRRVPEATLHLMEACGGWPGAFLAQRWVRHKVAKGRYQVVFWLIVAAWQGAAGWWVFR